MKTRILSAYNQKGGVGKSTISVNVAAALALMLSHETPANGYPERVLVVDLDQQINSEVTLSVVSLVMAKFKVEGTHTINGFPKKKSIRSK